MNNCLICPVIIKTDIKNVTEILPNIYLSKMTQEDKESYFNILEDQYGINNLYVTTNDPVQPDIFDYGFRVACNHKLIIPKNCLDNTINTLKLYKSSNFGIRYIRGAEYKDYDTIPNCIYIPKLELFIHDLIELNKLYPIIVSNINDELFNKLIKMYNRVLSFSELTPDEKFRDLVVMLEILYLQGESHNIKRILSNRIALYFKFLLKENYDEVYNFINYSYKIRSKIAHENESGLDFRYKDNEKLLDLLDIVRKSIVLYLNNMILFSKEKLKQVAIK